MLRVLVEVHPGGDSARKRTIAQIDLANVSQLRELSNYDVAARLEGLPEQRFRVNGHQRSHGWVPLVREALKTVVQSVIFDGVRIGSPKR